MKKQKKEEVKKTKTAHLQWWYHSFSKLDKAFAMTLIFDIAYVLAIAGLFMLFIVILRTVALPLAASLQSFLGIYLNLSATNGATNPAVTNAMSQSLFLFKSSLIKLGIVLIASLAAFFAVTSAYKAMIWMHLKNIKLTITYFKKFLWMNMLWQSLWFLVAVIVFLGFEVRAAAISLIIVLAGYMYFTPFFRLLLTEKHTWIALFKETFIVGVKKFRHFVVLIGVAPITVFVCAILIIIIVNLIAPPTLGVAMLALLLITMSWVRFYFFVIAKNVT
ncbi:hypothetical protein HZC31_02840 [Candidatus Woesearchaeota archaeon]|nr:hypothetical protein [Candidatus Woesearchaeota archaeon]